jgi:hypothetical protein
MATAGTEEGLLLVWPSFCCRQPRPRPAAADGHVPDPAAPDANHRSVTPLPVSPLSSSMYLFQILFFFNHVESEPV